MQLADDGIVLGLDIGSSGLKAMTLSPEGTPARVATVPTPFRRVATGAEMTPVALSRAVRDVLRALAVDLSEVRGIGLTGMAEAGCGLDDAGRASTVIPSWFDTRGEQDVAVARTRVSREAWMSTGRPLRTKSSLALAAALRRDHPFSRWLGVPELVLNWLTGASCTDPTLAARTGALDLGSGEYCTQLLAAYGLPDGVFPHIRPSGSVMGTTSTRFAREAGLPHDIPVTIAGHDHAVGVLAMGTGDDDVVDSVGTAELLFRRRDVRPDPEEVLDAGFELAPAPGPGWAITGSRRRPGAVLADLTRWLGHERSWLEEGDLEDDERLEEADRSAVAEATASGRVDGLPERLRERPRSTWNEALRALADDSIALLGSMDHLLGPSARLVVTGGGARSRKLVAAKRRSCPIPLIVSEEPDTSVLGAARRALALATEAR